jgi:hypothetical protein
LFSLDFQFQAEGNSLESILSLSGAATLCASEMEGRMPGLADEIRDFRSGKMAFETGARQMAALFLVSGIDLAAALATTGEARARTVRRIERLVERERLRGACRHWTYDLNRHIALKQALDRLRGEGVAAK